MKKSIFMDKYPVYSKELLKEEISLQNVDEILNYFQNKIKSHPVAEFISIFDHYSHTKNLNGEIMDDLADAKNIIFCFGTAIPVTTITAIRPRSISVCELKDKFVIEFMEVPKEELNTLIESWINGLLNK